ncbi:porin [Vogesella amnigena]|uniref:Porin n=1 Tax=Vogesella amnigena TaxID=1507449 RepID=A0ABV7TS22_9NEIS
MKKLIVLATLAALPAVALADVTISGLVGVNVQNVKLGHAGSANDMGSQEGEIDFAGSEKLGNGLNAIWKYSHQFNTDNRAPADENLETYIGLSGEFGRIQLGGTDNAAREISAVGLADLPTVFGVHKVSGQNAIYKSTRQRLKDGITYVAPNFGNLTLAFSHAMKSADNGMGHANNVAALYAVNDMLTVAYSGNFTKKQVSGKTDRDQEVNAAAAFGDFGVNLGYAWNKDYSSAVNYEKRRAVAVSGSYTLGATKLIVGWYKQSDGKKETGARVLDGYKNYSVGVDYSLSKRTNVGVEWAKADYRGSVADVRGVASYLYHKF